MRVSRELTKIDTDRRAGHARRRAIDRVSEIGLDVEAKDDREAVRAADALDGAARGCTPPDSTATRCRSITSIAWR